jgi:hypothetical protein
MQARKTMAELAEEIDRQQAAAKDFIAPASKIEMILEDDRPALALRENGTGGVFPVGKYAGGHLAEKLQIPKRYYDRMAAEAPDLLARNVNTWLKRSDSKHMIRTLDGNARAFLSDSYRPIDNWVVFAGMYEHIKTIGERSPIEFKACEITERKMYIQIVTPEIRAEVKLNEIVQAGLTISNSEIGQGSASFQSLLYFLACLNGMKGTTSFKKYHIGGRIGNQSGMDIMHFSNETRRHDDLAYIGAMSDMTKQALSEVSLKEDVRALQAATERDIKLENINETVQEVTKAHGLTESDGKGILSRLIKGGDLTQYGLSGAVTNLANDDKAVEDYDHVIELQKVGAELAFMSENDWGKLNKAAAETKAEAAAGA